MTLAYRLEITCFEAGHDINGILPAHIMNNGSCSERIYQFTLLLVYGTHVLCNPNAIQHENHVNIVLWIPKWMLITHRRKCFENQRDTIFRWECRVPCLSQDRESKCSLWCWKADNYSWYKYLVCFESLVVTTDHISRVELSMANIWFSWLNKYSIMIAFQV